ncbi:MAG: RagB/SusD family nutrient uptake outer membrane protein [Bacteroidales bacterium]|nr:RagB/SusD family nutrient uptake outer membrane protein [Bacteroidales bacterium]MBN2820545.1 RagB/SusD family nutrient uptake outer membrane protein [Bacteroidales bacterium]
MKKIIYFPVILLLVLLTGCEDFLTQKNLYEKSDESYFSSPEDVDEALTGAYAAIPNPAGNNNPFIVAKLMSDDAFGGGGANDDGFDATDAFTLTEPDYYTDLFSNSWPGILRVNLILKRFDQVEYTSESRKNQALGEAHFLRAFFYFRLSQFFGPVPLKLNTDPVNLPRATPEEMYGQIAYDLKTAIDIMPSTPYQSIGAGRLGHANKWIAQGYLARVFLFYTGYYNKTEIELADGSVLTKADVITYLQDCIDNSGYGLLPDFRNQWPYSDTVHVKHYPFNTINNLGWVGETGDNYESMFMIKYSVFGSWATNDPLSYNNQHSLYSGMRLHTTVPFGYGWGGGPVNPQLYESFEDGDLRRDGSIVNINDPAEGDESVAANYQWNADNNMDESGFLEKKYMPIYDSSGARAVSIYFMMYPSAQDNQQLWNMQDDVLLRFADILLMHSELTETADGMNLVRERAGLGEVSYSLAALQAERRHELAFEGLRYFDLLRWGIAEQAIEAANGVAIQDVGNPSTYSVDFPASTGGFLPIPKTEITLSNGVMEQTPGWDQYQ